MANTNPDDTTNEYLADVYERLKLQEQALIELLYDVSALKDVLTPEQLARFEKAKQRQAHDLGNAATAEQNRVRLDAIIAKLRGK